jgi:hypothetical protein
MHRQRTPVKTGNEDSNLLPTLQGPQCRGIGEGNLDGIVLHAGSFPQCPFRQPCASASMPGSAGKMPAPEAGQTPVLPVEDCHVSGRLAVHCCTRHPDRGLEGAATGRCQSCRTTLRRELWTRKSPL